ncbi:hypothetical protein, partial [Paraburkholderia sp. SIMBA_030]|uniref:hypothetical protein n=1 Tax=Paraburkholderia sp. SIMBA_030 TaxID=3085773 RepID=UPI00397B07C4
SEIRRYVWFLLAVKGPLWSTGAHVSSFAHPLYLSRAGGMLSPRRENSFNHHVAALPSIAFLGGLFVQGPSKKA